MKIFHSIFKMLNNMLYLYILPIINDLYALGISLIYKLGQEINSNNILGSSSAGSNIIKFTNSNVIGNIWLLLFIITLILGIVTFILSYFSSHKYYNKVGIACIASVIMSFIVVYYFFL